MSKNPKDPSSWIKTSPQYGYYKIPGKEVLGYSSIDFAMNLVFQCIALYISYFYTDIFGLKPGHVAIIFALSRIWDAINDPMMGTYCERHQPKKGKYWVYIRWGAIPFGLAAIMTYTTPQFSYALKVVWAVVGYNLLNMLYTFIIQPYISVATLMTNDQNERTRLQSVRMTLAQAGGVVCAIMLPELSGALSKHMTLAQGYMVTTIIMAVIMVAILLWGSKQIVERIPPQPVAKDEKAGIKDVFYLLFRVGPVFVTFILFLGVYTMSQVQATMGAITRVRVHYLPLSGLLEKALSDGIPVYGTFLDGDDIYGAELSADGILVMGNEGKGIGPDVEKCVSRRLYIPSYPGGTATSESLNVAVATAVACAEFRRRLR